MSPIYFAIIAAFVALVYGWFLIKWINKQPAGDDKMQAIAKAINEGANAYLKRQTKSVAVVAVIVFVLLTSAVNFVTAVGFLVGAVLSALAGYIGMQVSVKANVRTTEAAKLGLAPALNVAVRGGTVTGMMVVGLALLGVTLFYAATRNIEALIGLGFGGSLVSVFARLGGGIFTKSADVGADMVGKIEAGIPEDDPRNPAVIADCVGDNVGDCAGMAADLFETYAVTSVAAILLGSLIFGADINALMYPLALGGIAIIASIAGTLAIKLNAKQQIMWALYKGLIVAGVVAAVLFYPVTTWLMSQNGVYTIGSLYLSALIGIAVTGLIVVVTEYYTGTTFSPVQK